MVPLDYLRSLSNQYLPDTCSISRNTPTQSGDGQADAWASVATGVACRVSPLASSAQEAIGGNDAMTATSQWTIWLPAATDVTVRDRIVVGSRTFEVNRVGARSYEVAREALCREVV